MEARRRRPPPALPPRRLVIFHVYGSHIENENILRRIRERTVAEVLQQTDHLAADDRLDEETDPARE